LQGIKNAEIPQKVEEKEDTVSVTLCNESCNNLNTGKGSSTANLASPIEVGVSEKESGTLMGNSKEDVSQAQTPLENHDTATNEKIDPTQNDNASDDRDVKEKRSIKERKAGPPSVSCVIQFNTMWYNFAAPPQTPITRKIDYTR